ncbi:MAG: hypothetical protein KF805_04340 [Phycisphaeraceae bacterium]|nr:hypothetical protein [Phycisphaeraceae bacterium]
MKSMSCMAASARSTLFFRLLACLMLALTFASHAEAGAKRKPTVLYLHSDGFAPNLVADVKNKLTATGLFLTVDTFDGGAGTPTLAVLNTYDAVMVSNDGAWSNAANLGTALAAYVDGGGGVVQTVFTTGGVGGSNLAGNWTASYNSITFGPSMSGAATLGAIANQNHPIMIGVQTFDGGASSFRPNGTALTAGATLVASWSDGKPLVAVGPKINRCDLGMYPPSGDAQAGLWVSNTDGVKLMANALLYVMRPRVLIAGAPATAAWNSDVQSKLMATGVLGIVDIFNTSTGTPTLTQLQKYDAVLVYSDAPAFFNPTALGNVMADYVDWGGGVVSAMFAYNGGALSMGGRWQTGNYDIFNQSAQTSGSATLGAAVYPGHPILSGVVSFNGGSSSYRMGTTTLKPGGLTVVNWSDGRALAAVSTRMANRADLNFFPPSNSTGRADFWQAGTDGGKIMANALLYTAKPYVACVFADTNAADVVAKLSASRRFSGVGSVDVSASTPALATLSPFNAVAQWNNGPYSNPTTLGNTLADFVDAGGGAVSTLFGIIQFNAPLAGRWSSQGYEITPSPIPGYLTTGPVLLGAVLEPNNPIASFVRKFDGGTNSFRQNATPLLRGRTIMRWADGKMLASVHNYKKRADLGYWPVSNAFTNGWNQRTDGTWMTANALEFVVRAKPCPGDFNGDGFVDDTDFVLFADYYNNLLDPRGDLNGDGLTEDSDFVIFAGAYDQLLCP